MCPTATPNTRTIKENSEICANVVPTKKLVLLVYLKKADKAINIKGFPINTTADKISALIITGPRFKIDIFNPKIIKKIIKKKSLKGLTLELISTLYGETDKTIPAIKAPISIENPRYPNKAATKKHQKIENKNNNSWCLAILLINFGRI